MPAKWYDRKRKEGKLTVFNDAGAWKGIVDSARDEFNKLQLGVSLESSDSVTGADIIVRYSMGSGQDKNYSWATADFDAAKVHGQTASHLDDRGFVEKAIIFLPGKLKKLKDELKVVVTVHEMIHAAGLVAKKDHDPDGGVLYSDLQLVDGKLQEPGGAGMPPIRIGNWTKTQIGHLWS